MWMSYLDWTTVVFTLELQGSGSILTLLRMGKKKKQKGQDLGMNDRGRGGERASSG